MWWILIAGGVMTLGLALCFVHKKPNQEVKSDDILQGLDEIEREIDKTFRRMK
jgi:hypothetical protein